MAYQFQFDALEPYAGQLLQGLVHTGFYAAAAISLGVLIGIAGALGLVYGAKPLRIGIRMYVEFFRNTPALVQLFLIYFGLPNLGIRLEAPLAGVIALSLYCGSYMVEIIRSGLVSLPKGLTEAGLALGLSRRQIITHILSIPALQNVYPALAGQMVLTLIGTSLISQIGVEEVFHAGSFIDSRTFRSFEIYLVICALYFFAVACMKTLLGMVYRRFFKRKG
ncbi:MAG: amino acid ABC transporter permease [Formivibrio sp.]|nr:amino acid ABC transporter permease [Formivibrio sp.]